MSCLLQVSIHIFYIYVMSYHIQNKLIHLQWQIETYQSHIKYIQGQIRLIHRLFHLIIVLLNFRFQKCRDPNPRLDPVGESKPEPGLLRHFQLSSQNILFGFIKSVTARIPDSTRLVNPSRSPVYSDIFNYLLKTFCLVLLNFRFQKCRVPNPRLDPVGESKPEPSLLRHFQLSSQNILFVLFHFRLFNYAEALHFGNPINVYKFKRSITFTFNKMHLQIMPLYTHILMLFIFACFHFTNHLSYHNIHFQCNNSIHNSIYEI